MFSTSRLPDFLFVCVRLIKENLFTEFWMMLVENELPPPPSFSPRCQLQLMWLQWSKPCLKCSSTQNPGSLRTQTNSNCMYRYFLFTIFFSWFFHLFWITVFIGNLYIDHAMGFFSHSPFNWLMIYSSYYLYQIPCICIYQHSVPLSREITWCFSWSLQCKLHH